MEFTAIAKRLHISIPCLLPGFLLLLTLMNDVKALSCYICDSTTSASCSTHPFDVGLTDCSKWCNERSGFIPQVSISDPQSRSYRTYPPTPCPDKFTSCRKIWQSSTQTQENGGYPVERTIRACGFVGDENQSPYAKSVSESSRRVVYTCFGDGCNTGTGLHRGTGVGVLALALCWTLLTVGYRWLPSLS